VLADVGCWSNNFTFRNIVVFDVNDLEQITNVGVVVDNFTDLVDQMDD